MNTAETLINKHFASKKFKLEKCHLKASVQKVRNTVIISGTWMFGPGSGKFLWKSCLSSEQEPFFLQENMVFVGHAEITTNRKTTQLSEIYFVHIQ